MFRIFIKILMISGLLGVAISLPCFALEENLGQKFKIPIRQYSVIVGKNGYYPRALSVRPGEKIKFFLTTTEDAPSCLLLPEKKLFIGIEKGSVSEAEAIFREPGTYRFYCPKGKIEGKIVVIVPKKTEKEIQKIKAIKQGVRRTRGGRGIASVPGSKTQQDPVFWYPREE